MEQHLGELMKNLFLLLSLLIPAQAFALANTGKVDAGFVEYTTQASAPATPAAGKVRAYVLTSDGLYYVKNSAGSADNLTTKAYVDAAVASGGSITVSTKTTDYVLTNSDNVILMNCSVPCSLTAHSVATATIKRYPVKNIGTANVTILPNGTDTFDEDTSVLLPPGGSPKPAIELIPNGGTLWSIF